MNHDAEKGDEGSTVWFSSGTRLSSKASSSHDRLLEDLPRDGAPRLGIDAAGADVVSSSSSNGLDTRSSKPKSEKDGREGATYDDSRSEKNESSENVELTLGVRRMAGREVWVAEMLIDANGVTGTVCGTDHNMISFKTSNAPSSRSRLNNISALETYLEWLRNCGTCQREAEVQR